MCITYDRFTHIRTHTHTHLFLDLWFREPPFEVRVEQSIVLVADRSVVGVTEVKVLVLTRLIRLKVNKKRANLPFKRIRKKRQNKTERERVSL